MASATPEFVILIDNVKRWCDPGKRTTRHAVAVDDRVRDPRLREHVDLWPGVVHAPTGDTLAGA